MLELHGALADVRCTDCGVLESRDEVQRRIGELNPNFLVDGSAEGGTSRTTKVEVSTAPDGDADLGAELIDTFRIPACVACDGVLKPDVVFFGGNVPRDRVSAAFAMLDSAGALLVVGSSLAVFSGYRFVLRAADLRIPIAIVNRGETRGDRHAEFRIDAAAGDVLPTLARALC